MRLKTTVYLLFVILIFIGYVLVFEKYNPPTKEIEVRKSKPFTIILKKVEKITLKNTFGEKILIKKDFDSESWSILHPLHYEGDSEKIEEIIYRLATAKSERTLTSDKKKKLNLEEFGLRNPRFEISLLTDNKSTTLAIGKDTPLGQNMYVMLNNEPSFIYLLPNSLFKILNRNVDELRNKKVTYFNPSESISLGFQIPGKDEISYQKNKSGWYLTSPFTCRADEEKINVLLKGLAFLKIVEYADNDPSLLSQYGLGEKERIAIAIFKSRKLFKFIFFGKTTNKDEQLGYTKAFEKNYIYIASHAVLDLFPKKTDDWRDKKIIRYDLNIINGLKLEYKNEVLSILKQQEGWFINEPVKMQADEEKIENILKEIREIETLEFVSEKSEDMIKYGLTEPDSKISLFIESQEKPIVLSMKNTPDKVYVKNSSENTIFAVSLDRFKNVFKDYIEYKDLFVLLLPGEKISSLIISQDKNIKEIKISSSKQWMQGEAMVDPEKVYELIQKLSMLKAEKYISLKKENLSKYGLDNPKITISIKFENKILEDIKILIGNKTNTDSCYATIEGQKEIFTIDNNLYNLFVRDYL